MTIFLPGGFSSMKALLSFQEALERGSYRCRRTLSFPPPPPLQALSQSYKTGRSIAHHEGIPHPVGALFVLNREYEIHLPGGAIGEDSQERTSDNGNHTVLASYGGRLLERRLSVSSSHVVGSNNNIKTQYDNNSRGDSFCTLYACHHFDEETVLSTSYTEGLSCDPIVEVELQKGKGNFKGTSKLEKNLVSGLHQLHVHSKAVLPAKITLKSSVSTNFQGNGYSGLEFEWASSFSTCTSRFLLESDGNRELSLQGSQRFGKATQADLSASTNFDAQQSISLKVEHKVSEENKVSMNVTSKCFSIQEASIMSSFSQGVSSWKWKYRKSSEGEHLLGLEWQCRRNSHEVFSLSTEARRQGIAVNGELCYFLR